MSYEEFQRHLANAGLSLREFATLVRMNPRSLSNYARRKWVPSHLGVISALFAAMAEHRIEFRGVIAAIDLTPKKPRGAGKLGRFGGDKQRRFETLLIAQK